MFGNNWEAMTEGIREGIHFDTEQLTTASNDFVGRVEVTALRAQSDQATYLPGSRSGFIYRGGHTFAVRPMTGEDVETGEEVVIPSGGIVLPLTDGVVRFDAPEADAAGMIVAYLGRVLAVPMTVTVDGLFGVMSWRHVPDETHADALTDGRHALALRRSMNALAQLAEARRDAIHDIGVLLQAFVAGTFINGWQTDWDAEGEEYPEGHASAIRSAFLSLPLPVAWPTDHMEATRTVALFRVVQAEVGMTEARPFRESAMWEYALAGYVVPGVLSADYTGYRVGSIAPHDRLPMAAPMCSLALAEQHAADYEGQLARFRSDFREAWGKAWDVLNDAARTHDWCGEYEATSAKVEALTRTSGLTYASREVDYDVSGYAEITVTMTVSVPVSGMVTADSLDEAEGEAVDRLWEAANYEVAQSDVHAAIASGDYILDDTSAYDVSVSEVARA